METTVCCTQISAYPNLARLDGFPDIKVSFALMVEVLLMFTVFLDEQVVLRRDWDKNRTRQVAIISGGGESIWPSASASDICCIQALATNLRTLAMLDAAC